MAEFTCTCPHGYTGHLCQTSGQYGHYSESQTAWQSSPVPVHTDTPDICVRHQVSTVTTLSHRRRGRVHLCLPTRIHRTSVPDIRSVRSPLRVTDGVAEFTCTCPHGYTGHLCQTSGQYGHHSESQTAWQSSPVPVHTNTPDICVRHQVSTVTTLSHGRRGRVHLYLSTRIHRTSVPDIRSVRLLVEWFSHRVSIVYVCMYVLT